MPCRMLKFFVRTCDRCGSFWVSAEGRSCSFGDVERALMWVCFQSGGSAVFCFTLVVHHVIREIICRRILNNV